MSDNLKIYSVVGCTKQRNKKNLPLKMINFFWFTDLNYDSAFSLVNLFVTMFFLVYNTSTQRNHKCLPNHCLIFVDSLIYKMILPSHSSRSRIISLTPLKGLNIFNFRIFKNLSCSQKPGRNRFSILVTDDYWSRYFGVKKINYKLFRCLGKKENVNTFLLLFVLSCFIVW